MTKKVLKTQKKAVSHLPPGPGPGRPKGCQNKLTRTAKENIQAVYEKLGDIVGHVKFLQTHPLALADFYNNVYPRLLPLDVNHGGSVNAVLRFEYANGNGNGNGGNHG